MSIASETRQEILGFITARGKIPTAEVFTRFELMSKRAVEDHLTALVTSGDVVRGLLDVAPARALSRTSDDDYEPDPTAEVPQIRTRAKVAKKKAAPTYPKTDPEDKPRERVIELFRHRATWDSSQVYAALPDVASKTLYAVLWYLVQRGHLKQKGTKYTVTELLSASLQDRIMALFESEAQWIRREIVAVFPDVKRGAVLKVLTKLVQRKRLIQRGQVYVRPERAAEPPPPSYVPLSVGEVDRLRKHGIPDKASSQRLVQHIASKATGIGMDVARSAATPEPPPQPGQVDVIDLVVPEVQRYFGDESDIAKALVRDLFERAAEGKKKYGRLLQTHNGRDGDMDAYQEAADLVMYMRQRLEERHEAGEPVGEYRACYHRALDLMAFCRAQLCQDTLKSSAAAA